MQQKLEERRYLNEQIMNHQRLMLQIFTFSVITAIAILGWGSQSFPESGTEASVLALFLVLAPMAIILPCAFIMSAIRREIFGWAAYIVVFHKSGKGLEYETVIDKARDKFGRYSEPYASLVGTYWALCVICCGLFIYGIQNSSMPCGLSAVVVVPIGLLIFWSFKFVHIPSRSNRDRLKKQLLEVKQELVK